MAVHEFLIRSTDREDDLAFHLPPEKWGEVLRPASIASEVIPGWGNLRLRVLDSEVSFSDEEVGIQVAFETGSVSHEQAERIVREIATSATRATGVDSEIVPL